MGIPHFSNFIPSPNTKLPPEEAYSKNKTKKNTLNLRVGHQASEVKNPFFTYQVLPWEG